MPISIKLRSITVILKHAHQAFQMFLLEHAIQHFRKNLYKCPELYDSYKLSQN